MSDTQDTQASILVRLRTRMQELLRLGITTPEGFGMYQQTMLQLLQEFDRRKATCLEQAEHLRRQAAAAEAQAAAFGVSGSVLFAVVNGYLDIQEKTIREEQERDAQRVKDLSETPKEEVPAPKKNKGGRPKKVTTEPAGDAAAAPPGADPDVPNEG